ncbi:MAG: pseudouridine synthase [Saccharofermentanales bacterium]
MRLDRFLANAGLGTRTEVKAMIRKGQVKVDGETCRNPQTRLDEKQRSAVCLNDVPVELKGRIHIMLHKPAGVITAMDDPRQPTIAGLIPDRCRTADLFPVGRLDLDTTGLLLLTNDGTLGHRLTGPRWQVDKTYLVTFVGSPFVPADVEQFRQGIQLADGTICRPAGLEIQGENQVLLTIHEGKFHQVKRMMLATGREVKALHRQSIGPLVLDHRLAPGDCRELTAEETDQLYAWVGLDRTYNQ